MNESELQKTLSELGELNAQAVHRFLGKNNNLQNTVSTIDQGDYEWSEWFKAMAVLQLWLESKKLDYTLERKLGYLSCTVDAFKNTPTIMRPKLSEATERMLTQYGFSDQ